jgi:hypothetical protein
LPLDRTVPLGIESEPPRLLGICVRPSDPEWLLPLYTKAGLDIGSEEWERLKKLFLSYFYTNLALPGDDLHVNLSTFQKDRMMPRNVAQTELGRMLAEQDCVLKQVTASILHPNHPAGRRYWDEIEVLSKRIGNNGPVELWQKVWIVAGSATLQQKDGGKEFWQAVPPGYDIRLEDWCGAISECTMSVLCETDYLALQYRTDASSMNIDAEDAFHKQALDVFRREIVPVLVAEVNAGQHFVPLRQAYFAVALAKWYRENIAAADIHTRLMEVAAQMRTELGEADEIGPGPDAPDWMNTCYSHYVDLLDGVFRYGEPVQSATQGTGRVRIYHSGGVSFA